jgi:hypothetical protein
MFDPLFDFSMLWPDEIGRTDYRKDTTRYTHVERHVHQHTSKADEVIIECREKHWCIVTIDGCDYGLTGSEPTGDWLLSSRSTYAALPANRNRGHIADTKGKIKNPK